MHAIIVFSSNILAIMRGTYVLCTSVGWCIFYFSILILSSDIVKSLRLRVEAYHSALATTLAFVSLALNSELLTVLAISSEIGYDLAELLFLLLRSIPDPTAVFHHTISLISLCKILNALAIISSSFAPCDARWLSAICLTIEATGYIMNKAASQYAEVLKTCQQCIAAGSNVRFKRTLFRRPVCGPHQAIRAAMLKRMFYSAIIGRLIIAAPLAYAILCSFPLFEPNVNEDLDKLSMWVSQLSAPGQAYFAGSLLLIIFFASKVFEIFGLIMDRESNGIAV